MEGIKDNEEAKRAYWNEFADHYSKTSEKFMVQAYLSCAIMAGIYEATDVIEVGCGSGFHSAIARENLMKQEAKLTICDLSDEMMALCK